MKAPKGKITDVLIRVRDFIYPFDFIMLEAQPVPPKVLNTYDLRVSVPSYCQCNNQLLERAHEIDLLGHD